MPPVPPPRKGLLHVKPTKISAPRRSGGPVGGSRIGPASKGGDEGYLYLAGVRDGSKRITEFSSEKDVCPICHTDRQFNPSLRLLVSPCYHRMCESCIDRLFTLGPEPCPQCGRILRKMNFQHQTFEDLKVEKEVSVRRRMADSFNKQEGDFASRREYDDYLENVEEWNVEETELAIASYVKKNQTSIAENKERLALAALSQTERDEIVKQKRTENMHLVEKAAEVDREEEKRARVDMVDALRRGSALESKEIWRKFEEGKANRAVSLAKALRSSAIKEEIRIIANTTDPLGADYVGPFVPIPYSDPESLEYTKWYSLQDNYLDVRAMVTWAREDKEGKVRGGGWDLVEFWKADIEAGLMSLGIEPLR